MANYHITSSGKKIKLKNLGDVHLNNIIAFIERKAKKGITVFYGGGYIPEEMWGEEDIIFGGKVKSYFNYKKYKKELKRRRLTCV